LGDGLLVVCALCWALQIAVLADLVQQTLMPVVMSFACFVGTALLALLGIPFLEHPAVADIAAGWIDLLYTGVFSTAVAFTLQAIGQQHLPASNAAIVLSSESLFAALAGAIFLGERLPPLGYLGAAIIFGAIVLVELVPQLRRSTSSSQPAG
jgi:drug/metabolite transporter (DMT)-like permease